MTCVYVDVARDDENGVRVGILAKRMRRVKGKQNENREIKDKK